MSANILNDVLEKFDFFPRALPTFNIKGRDAVPSSIGGLLSLVLTMILSIYGIAKLNTLINRSAPIVANYTDQGAVSEYERLNLLDAGLTFAFGIEGFIDKELKNDPRYVRMLTRLYRFNDEGDVEETFVPHHICTPEDYKKLI